MPSVLAGWQMKNGISSQHGKQNGLVGYYCSNEHSVVYEEMGYRKPARAFLGNLFHIALPAAAGF